MVAEDDGDDLRAKYAPCGLRLWDACGVGEDVVDFLGGLGGAEGGLVGRGAVGPLGGEHADGGVEWRRIEVAGEDGGVCHVVEVAQYELGLCHAAQAVEGLEVGACHDNGVTVGQHEGALEQSTLLHLGVRVGQHDVLHLDEGVAREQPYAVKSSAELDGGAEEPLHAAVVGEFSDEVAAVLVPAVGPVGVQVHFLQRHEVGVVLLDEQANLLQAGVAPGVQVEGHDREGIGVGECRGPHEQGECEEDVAEFHNQSG